MEELVDKAESPSYKQVNLWSDGDTRMLLDLYAKYLPQIGPLRKFRNKKEMWSKVAEKVGNKSAKQCEERYKTVLRRKKLAVENNNTSGSKRQKIDFEEELFQICNLDDSIEPEIQISSQKIIKREQRDILASTSTSKKKQSVQDTLLEIAKLNEEAKERRHREKMEAIKDMKQNLERLFQQK
ncbi:uncharacterized protein LOC131996303 [Stomoxys calcitrans]|uniref:uncharacterized protein LOC131994249 n=1 Tax=Stomoxys calcitrans TaxID=35570 RepID=UPI0027E21CE5|nr:uncharacterized protein LOC131994249 [Stomoxys calcitrans]XP_059221859.1 uncharacterized protein LOC131996303 [Stomoxys calcitrans]